MNRFLRFLISASAVITGAVLFSLAAYVLIKGIPSLSADMFSLKYTSSNNSVMPSVINTAVITALALAIALVPGVFSAVYLCEYAGDSPLVAVIRLMTETLSGIPSIVYGLFGFLAFVIAGGMGYSILAGALTLSMMILPVVMRTSEEAIKAVDKTYKEGSYGLGAGKLRTVWKIILPAAYPGIMSGVVLSAGRILGETAALIYTAGTVSGIASNLGSSGRTLSVQMYTLWKEGIYQDKAYATAAVLLIVTVILNAVSSVTAKRVKKNGKN